MLHVQHDTTNGLKAEDYLIHPKAMSNLDEKHFGVCVHVSVHQMNMIKVISWNK